MKAAGEGGRTAGSWDWRRMGDGLRQESMDKNRNHVSRRFDPNRESSRCPRRVVKPNTWIAPAADRTDVTNQRRGLMREEIWYTETENMVDMQARSGHSSSSSFFGKTPYTDIHV